MKKTPKQLKSVVAILKSKESIRVSSTSRMSSTLKYLKMVGVNVSCPEPSVNTRPLKLVAEIQQVLTQKLVGGLVAYTDGSTKARCKDPNSGCGIYITDQNNHQVWSGGLIVRSDGNNFVPEVAAAAIVIMAVPLAMPLTLRIDSMATIGALSQGIVSERKRIRAAGRS